MKNKVIAFILLITMTFCTKVPTNENIFVMKLGDSKVYLLSEGQRSGNTGILIGATPEIIEKYAPNDSFPMATNTFLWQVDGKNILFDTGFGKNLFDNLKYLKLNPENIDIICITHLHGDHFGGLLREDQAAFPNAALYLAQPEYDYWTNEEIINQMPEDRRGGFFAAQKAIEAYKDRLHLFEPNAVDSPFDDLLLPGIKAIAAYGHTPGHTVFLLESGKDKLLIWGDLTHAMAVQMPHPEIAVTYDTDPETAIQYRLAIMEFAADRKIPVAGMHIPYPSIGTIEKATEGYRFVPE